MCYSTLIHTANHAVFFDRYIGSLSPKAGIRVLVHSQGVVPFPEEEGFDASPGAATSVGVKLVYLTGWMDGGYDYLQLVCHSYL